MAVITPTSPTHVVLFASADVARNAVGLFVADWRTYWKGIVHVRLARQGTTALTNGVTVIIRPAPDADGYVHPGPTWQAQSLAVAAQSTTVNADAAAGQAVLGVASTTSFAAGDFMCIGVTTAREEWVRVARVTSATAFLLDDNLQFAHTAAQADTVRNKADCWSVELPGATYYQGIIDYGDDAAGESIRAHVTATELRSVTST